MAPAKRKLHEDETTAIRMMMVSFDISEAYRRENNALRSILRKQGLSDVAIQGRVRRFLKKQEGDETAAQLLKRLCEESLKLLDEFDLKKRLRELELEGPPQ